jgi:CheY-like chemotaxis protein
MIKTASRLGASDDEDGATASAEDMLLSRGLEGLRVLLVEDDAQLRAVATLALERMGADVTEMADGESAMETIEGGAPMDLLFSDIDLGAGHNGFDLAVAARRRDRGVAVLLTSGNRLSLADAGRVGGDIAVVPKPYPLPDLISAIGRATGR